MRRDVLAANGKYRGLSSSKQVQLLTRQDRLLAMLNGKQTADLTE